MTKAVGAISLPSLRALNLPRAFLGLPLRARLVGVLLALLLPLLGLFGWEILRDLEHARRHAQQHTTNLARQHAAQIELFLRDQGAVMRRIAERPQVRAMDGTACDPWVAEFQRLHPQYTSINLRTPDGTAICTSMPGARNFNPIGLDWFQRGLREPGLFVGDAMVGPASGRWIAALTFPVMDRHWQVNGVVTLPLDLLLVGERQLMPSPGGVVVSVLDRQGRIVMRSDNPARWIGRFMPRASERLADQQGHVTGDDEKLTFWAASAVPSGDWRVVAEFHEDLALVPARREAQKLALLVACITLGALLFASWRARSFMEPMRALVATIQRAAAGDSQARVRPDGPVEIRRLAEHLNTLLDARERAETRLEDFLSLSADWYWETDSDDRFVYMSDSIVLHSGLSSAGYLGRTRAEVVGANWSGQDLAVHQRLFSERKRISNLEVCREAEDGSVRWSLLNSVPQFSAHGEFLGYRGTGSDITARKLEQAALLRSSALLEASESIAQLGGWELEVASGKLFWTPQTYRLHEVDPASFDPTVHAGLHYYLPASRERLSAALKLAIENGEGYDLELQVRTAHGRVIDVRTTCQVSIEQGRTVRLTGIFQEISDRKQMEAQLRESQKMEAMGTLAGGIAHDFNNVLAVILGNVHLARSSPREDESWRFCLEQIDRAAVRAKNLVQQILTFSRRHPQEMRVQELTPLIEDSTRMLRATLPAMVDLTTHFTAEPLPVLCNEGQIGQLVVNLCTNAWQALQGSTGVIKVQLQRVRLGDGPAPVPAGLTAGDHARLVIEDNGIGMDAATLGRIFEPFFTTKPVGQGTGLGLSVVHGIVKAHQGAVRVSSRPGQGTLVEVLLPLQPLQATPEPQQSLVLTPAPDGTGTSVPSAPGQDGRPHVMYVDDDPSMVTLVQRMLSRLGYRVSVCASAEAALRQLAEPAKVDLLVTDFNMPAVSGLELAHRVSAWWPGLPIIITSGFVTDELRVGAQAAGVRCIVAKPQTVDDLAARVSEILREEADRAKNSSSSPVPGR